MTSPCPVWYFRSGIQIEHPKEYIDVDVDEDVDAAIDIDIYCEIILKINKM